MRLFRFGQQDSEKPGVVTADGKQLDVSAFGEDYNGRFFATDGVERLSKWLSKNLNNCPEIPADSRIASCVALPSKLVAIGLNYTKHANESGMAIPKEPIVFMKATTCICGPYDNVIIPPGSVKTDWEAELAIIIGRKASYVSEAEVKEYIAGYSIIIDYSEREYQSERGGSWDKGKSADTFGPLGPYLKTAAPDFDPTNLKIWLSVNGELMQNSNTADMIFNVYTIVSYVSQFMTLLPGDVIATGTPAGVGFGFKPQRYLKPGDIIETGIEELGTQKQTAISYS